MSRFFANIKDLLPHLLGAILVALLATLSLYGATFSQIKALHLSPLVLGIIVGMLYANTLRPHIPAPWRKGVIFSAKPLLKLAIILYGFKLTFQNIIQIGLPAILVSIAIVILTLLIAYLIGTKLLKLDQETTILIGAGSGICGAAAILATESAINCKPYKSTIALATVVLFGTIGMFLYPFLQKYLLLSPSLLSAYIGGTLHEVAQVVGTSNFFEGDIAHNALIVKMMRVMLLGPFLICLSLSLAGSSVSKGQRNLQRPPIPWFALGFIGTIGIHSLNIIDSHMIEIIHQIDRFLLTMAMTAIGMETSMEKFKAIGLKSFTLGAILFVWLMVGGLYTVKLSFLLTNIGF